MALIFPIQLSYKCVSLILWEKAINSLSIVKTQPIKNSLTAAGQNCISNKEWQQDGLLPVHKLATNFLWMSYQNEWFKCLRV